MSRHIAEKTSTRIDWSAFTTLSSMPPHDPDEEDEDEDEEDDEDRADEPAVVREPDDE
jgi:hypothetical protein